MVGQPIGARKSMPECIAGVPMIGSLRTPKVLDMARPGAGFAIARGTPAGFTEAGRFLTNWGTPTWGGVGDFDGDTAQIALAE